MRLEKRGKYWYELDADGKVIKRTTYRPKDVPQVSLRDYLYSLDVNDASLWTKSGAVRMAVVEKLFGRDTDRHHITDAVGDEFSRTSGRE
ncbi:hypothetical protein NVP1015O_26 [Vibrio phage 1.015.O._10N.222.51.E5]|nr:hypothetical protein NVP1015O_26 [Vibrio phage 1.015.O._10N.222.51.E5]